MICYLGIFLECAISLLSWHRALPATDVVRPLIDRIWTTYRYYYLLTRWQQPVRFIHGRSLPLPVSDQSNDQSNDSDCFAPLPTLAILWYWMDGWVDGDAYINIWIIWGTAEWGVKSQLVLSLKLPSCSFSSPHFSFSFNGKHNFGHQ